MRTRRLVIAALLAFVICVMASACFANERETVLDRKVHIEDKILDVPKLPPLCEEIKGLQREKIDIGNGKLYCEQEGTGVPLVVVSGGPGSTHHTFHSYFSRAAAFARVIYYDQRGVGQSDYDKTGKMYTLEQAVEDLDNLRKALKIEKWVVLGHSYGGFLAQCYALEHPDRLLGLVLVCSAPGNGDRQSDYMSEAELQQIDSLDGNITLTDDQCRFNRELNGDWKRQSFYKPSIEEMARTALYEWKPAPGFQSRICSETRLMELMASLNSKFDRFPVPTLVMESKRDLTWAGDKPVKFHRNHPGSQLVMFEKSAHSPFADEPDKFFKALLSFTENVRDGSKTANVRSENRVRWQVPAVCYKIEQMPFTGAADEALQLLPEAEEAKLENSTMWFTLGYHLCSGFYYDKALIAFQQSAESRSASRGDRGLALAYQGLLLDLLNHRAEAVAAYREALRGIGQAHSDSDVFGGITIDRQWVKERIKTPFVQPPEVYYEILQMPRTGAADEALRLLPQAEEAKLENYGTWFRLAENLCSGGHYEKALSALRNVRESKSVRQWRFGLGLAYQGLLLDLLNRRPEAISAYKEALTHIGNIGYHSESETFGIRIDGKWLEERLITPYITK